MQSRRPGLLRLNSFINPGSSSKLQSNQVWSSFFDDEVLAKLSPGDNDLAQARDLDLWLFSTDERHQLCRTVHHAQMERRVGHLGVSSTEEKSKVLLESSMMELASICLPALVQSRPLGTRFVRLLHLVHVLVDTHKAERPGPSVSGEDHEEDFVPRTTITATLDTLPEIGLGLLVPLVKTFPVNSDAAIDIISRLEEHLAVLLPRAFFPEWSPPRRVLHTCAIGEAIYASSSSQGHGPTLMTDGCGHGTYWASAPNKHPVRLLIALPEGETPSELHMTWREGHQCKVIALSGSVDRASFTEFARMNPEEGDIVTSFELPDGSANYQQYRITMWGWPDWNNNHCYALSDLRLISAEKESCPRTAYVIPAFTDWVSRVTASQPDISPQGCRVLENFSIVSASLNSILCYTKAVLENGVYGEGMGDALMSAITNELKQCRDKQNTYGDMEDTSGLPEASYPDYTWPALAMVKLLARLADLAEVQGEMTDEPILEAPYGLQVSGEMFEHLLWLLDTLRCRLDGTPSGEDAEDWVSDDALPADIATCLAVAALRILRANLRRLKRSRVNPELACAVSKAVLLPEEEDGVDVLASLRSVLQELVCSPVNVVADSAASVIGSSLSTLYYNASEDRNALLSYCMQPEASGGASRSGLLGVLCGEMLGNAEVLQGLVPEEFKQARSLWQLLQALALAGGSGRSLDDMLGKLITTVHVALFKDARFGAEEGVATTIKEMKEKEKKTTEDGVEESKSATEESNSHVDLVKEEAADSAARRLATLTRVTLAQLFSLVDSIVSAHERLEEMVAKREDAGVSAEEADLAEEEDALTRAWRQLHSSLLAPLALQIILSTCILTATRQRLIGRVISPYLVMLTRALAAIGGSAPGQMTEWVAHLLNTITSVSVHHILMMIQSTPLLQEEVDCKWLDSTLIRGGIEASSVGGSEEIGWSDSVKLMSAPPSEDSLGEALLQITSGRPGPKVVRGVRGTVRETGPMVSSTSIRFRSALRILLNAARSDFLDKIAFEADGDDDDEENPGDVLLDWLKAHKNEAFFLRRRGTWPKEERLYLACMLRHTGLWKEAKRVVSSIMTDGIDPKDVKPSATLLAAWKHVLQFRNWIRQQKQRFASAEDSPLVVEEEDPLDGIDSFEDLLRIVGERLQFLFKLSPSATTGGTLPLFSGTGEGMGDDPLMRWQSVQSNRFLGVVSVLKAQHKRHKAREGGDGSEESEDEDETFEEEVPNASLMEILQAVTQFMQMGPGMELDQLKRTLELRSRRASERTFGIIAARELLLGIQQYPSLCYQLLQPLRSCFHSLSTEQEVSETGWRTWCIRNASKLSGLRTRLAPGTPPPREVSPEEWKAVIGMLRTARDLAKQVATDAATPFHGCEGCCPKAALGMRDAFCSLFTEMVVVLRTVLEELKCLPGGSDAPVVKETDLLLLAHSLMWGLSMKLEESELGLLVDSKLLATMIGALSWEKKLDGAKKFLREDTITKCRWAPAPVWGVGVMNTGLRQGVLPRREMGVYMHQLSKTSPVPESWWSLFHLIPPLERDVGKHTCSSLLYAYQSFHGHLLGNDAELKRRTDAVAARFPPDFDEMRDALYLLRSMHVIHTAGEVEKEISSGKAPSSGPERPSALPWVQTTVATAMFRLLSWWVGVGTNALRASANADGDQSNAAPSSALTTSTTPVMIKTLPLAAQNQLFSGLENMLEQASEWLAGNPVEYAPLEPLEVDAMVCDILELLITVAHTRTAQLHVTTPAFARTLCRLLRRAPPRRFRLVVRLFRGLGDAFAPSVLAGAFRKGLLRAWMAEMNAESTSEDGRFIMVMLRMIASALCVEASGSSRAVETVGSSIVLEGKAGESMALLRHMLAQKVWCKTLLKELLVCIAAATESLHDNPDVVRSSFDGVASVEIPGATMSYVQKKIEEGEEEEEANDSKAVVAETKTPQLNLDDDASRKLGWRITNAVAALAVLGGAPDWLRAGGKVKVTLEGAGGSAEGFLLSLAGKSPIVAFPAGIEEVPIDSVAPLDELRGNARVMPLGGVLPLAQELLVPVGDTAIRNPEVIANAKQHLVELLEGRELPSPPELPVALRHPVPHQSDILGWTAQLRATLLGALTGFLKTPEGARAALDAKLVAPLMDCALVPIDEDRFVTPSEMSERRSKLQRWMLEATLLQKGVSSGRVAALTLAQTRLNLGGGTTFLETEEDEAKRQRLERELTPHGGAPVSKVPPCCDFHNKPGWDMAHALAGFLDKPVRLCFHALILNHGDQYRASSWLLELPPSVEHRYAVEQKKLVGSAVAVEEDVSVPWNCGVCTYQNNADDDTCAMCFTPKAEVGGGVAEAKDGGDEDSEEKKDTESFVGYLHDDAVFEETKEQTSAAQGEGQVAQHQGVPEMHGTPLNPHMLEEGMMVVWNEKDSTFLRVHAPPASLASAVPFDSSEAAIAQLTSLLSMGDDGNALAVSATPLPSLFDRPWNCPVCTYRNLPQNVTCDMCQSDRVVEEEEPTPQEGKRSTLTRQQSMRTTNALKSRVWMLSTDAESGATLHTLGQLSNLCRPVRIFGENLTGGRYFACALIDFGTEETDEGGVIGAATRSSGPMCAPAIVRDRLQSLALQSDIALVAQHARKALLEVLRQWPADVPLTAEALGGGEKLLLLIRLLVASDEGFARDRKVGGGDEEAQSVVVVSLRKILKALMEEEVRQMEAQSGEEKSEDDISGTGVWECAVCTFENPSGTHCEMCAAAKPVNTVRRAGGSAQSGPLASALLHNCVSHLERSTRQTGASGAEIRESLHPHVPSCSYTGVVVVPGSSAVRVTFDPRCDIDSVNSSLTFYADDTRSRELVKLVGSAVSNPALFKPFIIYSDKVYWQFFAKNVPTEIFGFRFAVTPLKELQWLNERQVLHHPSLEWACWLMSFMLYEAGDLLREGVVHNPQVFDALVRYLRSTACPFKHRILGLLQQLFHSPWLFNENPKVEVLKGVWETLQSQMSEQLFLPKRTLQLLGLRAVMGAGERELSRPGGPVAPQMLRTMSRGEALNPPLIIDLPLEEEKERDRLVELWQMCRLFNEGMRLPDDLFCEAYIMSYQKEGEAKYRRLQFLRANSREAESLLLSCGKWRPAMDAQLTDWLIEVSKRQGTDPGKVNPTTNLTASDSDRFQKITQFSKRERALRIGLLRLFNTCLSKVLNQVDLGAKNSWELGFVTRSLGYIVFVETKQELLKKALEANAQPEAKRMDKLRLDHEAAAHCRERNIQSFQYSRSLFVQAFEKMHSVSPECFCVPLHSRGFVFEVEFMNEPGRDWGGLFRDAMNDIVADLFNPEVLDLFVLSPNGTHHDGMNQDKYLPNPLATSPRAIQMFEFIGKLMGMSLRYDMALPFQLPSLCWKPLVRQMVTRQDLVDVDKLAVQSLDAIRACENDGIDEDNFSSTFNLSFITTGADGLPAEVVPEGRARQVTFENRAEYCTAAENHRLHEFDPQLAAIRRGFGTLVAERAVQLFTWKEMEKLVCGSADIDVDLLKEHTRLCGYSPSEPQVGYFWGVMRSMTPEERTLFVRFAWGRSRLPAPNRWPASQPFKLTKNNGSDSALPLAHT